ncbi:MAG: methyltransferase domain-containing protein [Acidimicrobiia bacterium]|nr:methyltransferase domain-containing protein [Acidimicrobiia bacterium]
MSVKLTNVLKKPGSTGTVDPTIREYERRFEKVKDSKTDSGENDHQEFNNLYYDVATDFYEYGWGRSFHFAPRVPGESLEASIRRHEHFLAHKLALSPGMVVADLGCGIGGPLLEIARFSGAKIVGVNSNAYQLERARKLTEEAKLTHLADFLHCDFLDVDAPDESFDAVYGIEATCCAPDKVSIYGEAFRLLKPGGCFAAYEWCLTNRFDADNPLHLKIKDDLLLGTGLTDLDDLPTVDHALKSVGFEVLETTDLDAQRGPSIPWYQPLVSPGFSLASLRASATGRWITHHSLRALEALRVVPQGAVRVQETLNIGATALAEAGKLGIFTPAYFFHARKPSP